MGEFLIGLFLVAGVAGVILSLLSVGALFDDKVREGNVNSASEGAQLLFAAVVIGFTLLAFSGAIWAWVRYGTEPNDPYYYDNSYEGDFDRYPEVRP